MSECVAICIPGFRFTDGEPVKTFRCDVKQPWTPSHVVPDCETEKTQQAAYNVVTKVLYRAASPPVPDTCLSQYAALVLPVHQRRPVASTELGRHFQQRMPVDEGRQLFLNMPAAANVLRCLHCPAGTSAVSGAKNCALCPQEVRDQSGHWPWVSVSLRGARNLRHTSSSALCSSARPAGRAQLYRLGGRMP